MGEGDIGVGTWWSQAEGTTALARTYTAYIYLELSVKERNYHFKVKKRNSLEHVTMSGWVLDAVGYTMATRLPVWSSANLEVPLSCFWSSALGEPWGLLKPRLRSLSMATAPFSSQGPYLAAASSSSFVVQGRPLLGKDKWELKLHPQL